MSQDTMTLRIWTPERLLLKTRTEKIIAEAGNGFFCLLPRHLDYLAVLVPGVLTYRANETENYMAVNRGVLVKCGLDVMISVRNAIPGDNLEELEDAVLDRFRRTDLKEEEISQAMSQLEADFIQRFIELNEQWRHGSL